MRKLTSLERMGLWLGIVMVLTGGWFALFPEKYSAGIAALNYTSDASYHQYVSKEGCRVYGLISVGVGLGLGALAVYPLKR